MTHNRSIGKSIRSSFWTLPIFLLSYSFAIAQSGHVLNGVGPVDEALSGAGMAYPQEAAAALNWNPASITGFQTSEVSVNLQLLFPTTTIASSLNAGAFGPGVPPVDMAGESSSQAGPFPIPALAYVNSKKDRPWSIGIAAVGVGGFGVRYEGDNPMEPGANPIVTPQPPNGFGFGALDSEFSLLQVIPTFAYKFSEKVSVGVAPTFNIGLLEVSPFPGASPDDANGDGFPSYPSTDTETATGVGFQVGVQASDLNGFHLGASFKSQQKFSAFQFKSQDEVGDPREFEFQLDYPMIISGAVAYSGVDKLVLMGDARYIDFENTAGFDKQGYDETGAVTGFGWKSIVVIAVGAQYHVTPKLPIRIGYSHNDNPIEDGLSFFNVVSPAIIVDRVSAGLSYDVSPKVTASFAVQYGLENKIEGPWVPPMAYPSGVPGTTVSSAMNTLFIAGGIQIGI
jgi:long-chain fatty acid transport protein